MNAAADAERRRFYRIDEEVALRYRVVSADELDAALRRLQLGYPDRIGLASAFASSSAQMRTALDRVRHDLPEVATCLQGLNDKLDLLVQMMAASENELADHPTHNVNLSASGISFECAEPIEVGSTLEVKLLMFPSYLCILCFGTVVHCQAADAKYQIGVDFSHIRENDRELIVQHVTRRQSEVLRAARHALDTAEAEQALPDHPPG